MCSNYEPVTLQDRLLAHFGVERPKAAEPPELTFPGYGAPFIILPDQQEEVAREAQMGLFGLVPHWAKDLAFGRKTYNARTETVHEKPTYRDAWRRGHHCVVPVEQIHEPCYETGKHVKMAIKRRDGKPMGIAGLWGVWLDKATGQRVLSFTMLTINADGHEVFQRMHKPEDEKRMVVILDESDYDGWLSCSAADAHRYLKQFPAERLVTFPVNGSDPTLAFG